MKLFALVQARMSSSRLPGKVLKKIGGSSVLSLLFHQLSFSKLLHECILVTSNDPSDDILEHWAIENKVKYYRGDLNNVLKRYYDAAVFFNVENMVRITGDCPLVDPEIVDTVIQIFMSGNYDYCSNINPPTFPDGLDVEVFSLDALTRAYKSAVSISAKEHVTPFIWQNPDLFNIGNVKNEHDLSEFRLTLDNLEDLVLITKIYEKLFNPKSFISWGSIIEFLIENSELLNLNKRFKRNEFFI